MVRTMMIRSILLAALFLCASPAMAREQVWLIGGGPSLESSEAQIERNVLWAKRVIQGLPGDHELQIRFNDGDDPRPDVVEWRPVPDRADTLQPLARLYDSYRWNGERFRNHDIPEAGGTTRKEELLPALGHARDTLKADDGLWLLFNGHGQPAKDPLDHSLLLWGDTQAKVRDLLPVLSRGPATAPTRFLFTQCYAGAFNRLVYRDADPREGLADYGRCGFTAVPAELPAEGCSPGLEAEDYRDYSTFFFAALLGETRTGDPLAFDPDRDGDGSVSPYEAHLYSLRAARSTDMPISTSEDYLLRWAPWYARWWPWVAPEPTVYGMLARELAEDLGLRDPGNELPGRRNQLRRQIERVQEEQGRRRHQIEALRTPLLRELEARWPAAAAPYTLLFRQFLDRDLEEAQAFLMGHDLYSALAQAQDGYWALVDAERELERGLTQLKRLEHLQYLDRVLRLFQASASGREQAEYRRLLHCEQMPF